MKSMHVISIGRFINFPQSAALVCIAGIMLWSGAVSAKVNYSCWNKTFEDQFNTLQLREGTSGLWKPVYSWGDGGINNEKQYYADPRKHGVNPFVVKNGLLHIQATKTPSSVLSKVRNMKYVSGLLTTEGSFDQIYGLFEMRAKLPAGKGLWPAFWMLPTDKFKWQRERGYPRLPEIDIMEALGHEEAKYHATLHTKTPSRPGGGFTIKHSDVLTKQDLSKDFHVYGLSWSKTELVWYFDGKEVKRESTPPDSQDDAKYLLLNLAVGGNWPGNPDGKTRFPARFTIDWVRAYAKKTPCVAPPASPVFKDLKITF